MRSRRSSWRQPHSSRHAAPVPAQLVETADRATSPCRRFFDDLASLISFTIHLGQLISRPSRAGSRDVFRRLGAFSPVLLQMTFTRGVDSFSIYLSEMLGLVFTTRPETLRSREQVRVEEVLQHQSLEELLGYLANRRVERLAYAGLATVAQELEGELGFSLFERSDELERAVQIVEARNLIVHNRGIVNTTYLRRVRGAETVGSPLPIDPEYVLGSLELLAVSCADIDERAAAKFGLATTHGVSLPEAVSTALRERSWLSGTVLDPEDRA
jgi:hypothetical protein